MARKRWPKGVQPPWLAPFKPPSQLGKHWKWTEAMREAHRKRMRLWRHKHPEAHRRARAQRRAEQEAMHRTKLSPPVHFRLREEQLAWLKQRAAARNLSVSQLIRTAIDAMMYSIKGSQDSSP